MKKDLPTGVTPNLVSKNNKKEDQLEGSAKLEFPINYKFPRNLSKRYVIDNLINENIKQRFEETELWDSLNILQVESLGLNLP